MKISLKIFLFTYCIMVSITIIGGFFLINSAYWRDLEQAREVAVNNNKTFYTYVATLEEVPGNDYSEYSFAGLSGRMSGSTSSDVFIGDYASWKKQIIATDMDSFAEGKIVCSIIDRNGNKQFQVTSRYKKHYIINYYDISGILRQRDSNYTLYREVIISASVVIAVIFYLFSWFITRPLTKVTAAARRIAKDNS